MAKYEAVEVLGDGGDAFYLTARDGGGVGLTVVSGETGRSVYVALDGTEAVESLREALAEMLEKS